MSVKYAFLGILVEEPRHGYDIKRAFDERIGELWNLNVGQIYSTLDKLEKDGLIEHEEVEQDGKPDKKIYRITAEGKDEFEAWRLRPVKTEPRTMRDELFLKILFMDTNQPETVLHHIRSQQSVYMAYMMRLTERKYQTEQTARRALDKASDTSERQQIESDRLLNTIMLDAALFHAEADIRWLKHCEAKLRESFQLE